MKTTSTITFESVSKSFRKTEAIRNLSFSMPETGIVGLVGRNGSGKTTLLNLASSLTLPTSGSVTVFGENSAKLSEHTVARIGVVPHKPKFIEGFSVRQYLNLLATFYKSWDSQRVDHLIKVFSLDDQQRIMGLSEGQRQMLAIIVSVAHRPRLLLLDEPMSNLDPLSRAETVEMLWKLLLDDGVLIVMSSHILNDVEKVADWITFLDDGTIGEHDSLDNIRMRFQEWEIQSDSASKNPLEGLPGIINSRFADGNWTATLSQAQDPKVLERSQQLNGSLNRRHLSLEEIFPHIQTGADHE